MIHSESNSGSFGMTPRRAAAKAKAKAIFSRYGYAFTPAFGREEPLRGVVVTRG